MYAYEVYRMNVLEPQSWSRGDFAFARRISNVFYLIQIVVPIIVGYEQGQEDETTEMDFRFRPICCQTQRVPWTDGEGHEEGTGMICL